MEETSREKWIVDTDPGLDDMMAISYLMAKPHVDILMMGTTDGNVGLEIVTNNIKKVLKLSKKSIPVYKGSPSPIIKTFSNLNGYYYADGLGEIEEIQKYDASDIYIEKEPSAVKIVETIMKYPHQVNLLLIGPLTNIATAYMLNPEISNIVKGIYIMGGSIQSAGNLNCPGEFNFAYDYLAAKIVFTNFKNITLIPWEPTEVVYIRNPIHEKIPKILESKNKKINHELYSLANLIVKKYTENKSGIQFCDLYALMCAFNCKIVKRYAACVVDIIIDSQDMVGMLQIKKRKEFVKSYEETVNEFKKLGPQYHLIVEEFHENEVLFEYENVFHVQS